MQTKKNKNMKQLLYLFLFLLPCLAWAQYPSNGNQKITLGEQTTADGLIYRGVLADTGIITPSSDTSAYIILDTINHRFYNYNRATNVWSVTTIGSISSGLTGVLPLLNGGTGSATQNFVDLTNTQTVGGLKTFSSTVTGARFNPTSSVVSGTGMYLPSDGNLSFSVNGVNAMNLSSSGSVGINVFPYNWGTYKSLDIGLGGSISSVQYDNLVITTNGYNTNNTVWRYKSNSLPAVYEQYQGAHYFGYALTGTKDSIFSFAYPLVLKLNLLGLGTTNPAVQFHTTGGVRFAGLTSITDLRTDADGDLFNGSDFNLKNSIDTINFGLKDVLKLKPVQFNWNDISRNLNEYKNLGFIAQDVMDVIPNAASSMGDGDMQVDYNAIVATLTKAIQEQQAIIKALEQRIINLENK
jgi:hypothetical protein